MISLPNLGLYKAFGSTRCKVRDRKVLKFIHSIVLRYEVFAQKVLHKNYPSMCRPFRRMLSRFFAVKLKKCVVDMVTRHPAYSDYVRHFDCFRPSKVEVLQDRCFSKIWLLSNGCEGSREGCLHYAQQRQLRAASKVQAILQRT